MHQTASHLHLIRGQFWDVIQGNSKIILDSNQLVWRSFVGGLFQLGGTQWQTTLWVSYAEDASAYDQACSVFFDAKSSLGLAGQCDFELQSYYRTNLSHFWKEIKKEIYKHNM